MKYKYIVFDLDGTLTDPYEGITNSVSYAMKKMGREIPDGFDFSLFIGPPLYFSFEEFFGMSKQDASVAVDFFREYYNDRGLYENVICGGISDILKDIKESGGVALVGTSKPQVFAERVLSEVGIYEYFDAISGADMSESHSSKEHIIRRALELARVPEDRYSECLMVGDRCFDIEGAKLCGIDSAGVLWGYGSTEEFVSEGATHIAATPDELMKIIRG